MTNIEVPLSDLDRFDELDLWEIDEHVNATVATQPMPAVVPTVVRLQEAPSAEIIVQPPTLSWSERLAQYKNRVVATVGAAALAGTAILGSAAHIPSHETEPNIAPLPATADRPESKAWLTARWVEEHQQHCDPSAGSDICNPKTEALFRFLLQENIPRNGAAAVVANVNRESGADPGVMQGYINKDNKIPFVPIPGVGIGLAQWSTPDRQNKLVACAQKLHLKLSSLAAQGHCLLEEMQTGFKTSWRAVIDRTRSARDISEVVTADYERPKRLAEAKVRRANDAERVAVAMATIS